MAERELSSAELRDLYNAYKRAMFDLGFTSFQTYAGTDEWRKLLQDNKQDRNPAFLPDMNPEINDATGLCLIGYVGKKPVAGVCARLYPEITDFDAFIESGKMWCAPHQAIEGGWEHVPLDPRLCFWPEGNMVQIGGLFIKKGAVKSGGGKYLARMMRLAAMSGWANPGVKHIIGLLSDSTYKRFPQGNAGCKPIGIIARGLRIGCPPTDFWLTHAKAHEGLRLHGYKHDQPSDVAKVV